MVPYQNQWCCSNTMLPPPMMNMPPPYNFIKGVTWHHAAELLPRKQWKGYPGSILAPWNMRTLNSTIYIYNEFESSSFFIIIIIIIIIIMIYLVFTRIRGLSCDFVNYLMKFRNWQRKKLTCFWMADLIPISSFREHQQM